MSGTVNIARDLWDDPTFKDGEMSQREAWIWLIAQCSWKPRTKRVGTHEVSLERGQLAASTRFLAAAWEWSEPRVRRYLDMLEDRRMIRRVTDAGVSVITVCNYDKYQPRGRANDATSTQQPTQARRTADANKKKGEIREEKEEEGAPAREASLSIFDELRSVLGVTAATAYWSDAVCAEHVERWRALGLTDAQIIDAATASRSRNPDPPDGPKGLDRWMAQTAKGLEKPAKAGAGAPAAPKAAPMTEPERLAMWAERLNSPAFVPPSAISVTTARALVAKGLVDPDNLKRRGIAA